PNTLDHPSYQHKLTWDFSKSEDADLFHPVVAASPREHVLSVSRLGAWGNGTTNEGSVLLTTYLPHAMSSEEARRFYANGIAYGKFHYLYLEVGPEVPKSTSVASAVRTATMNMYRTGAPSYIEMAFILYVWEGASAAATTGATSVPATAPPTLAADAGDAQITLTWTRPLANGSATPFEFHIWRGSSPDTTQDVGIRVPYGSWSSAPLTFVDSGPHLQNGDTYYYTVRLETRVNAQLPGTAVLGAPSAVASATPIGLPGAPGQPTATSGLGRVTLEWTPPAQTGGGAIYGYAVYASPASATPRAFTLLGEVGSTTAYAHFVPDTAERVYRVEALNARGFGPASAESAPAGAIAPIDPPALAVSAGVGPGNLTLTWAAPDTLGQTLVGYRIYRATTAAGAFTELAYLNEPLAVSFADVGLGANATRWYKVQGVTSLGDGQNSSAQSQKTMATPDTPTGLAVTRVPATNTHTISWLPPVQSDWPVVRYDVWRGTSASNLQFVKSASTTSTTDTPGSGTWWYAVRAVSAAGASDLTAAVRP
ncbi:MAG TPA: hypothetical protein VM582_01640, partial [Candidatus Thermoplasmatota archaeon]|nr:hypothetical protein [Candidatus Thermoplasmatota archaeon]